MPRKNKKVLFIILIFCVVLLLGKFLSNPLNSAFHKVFSPVEKYFWNKGQQTGAFFYYFFNAKAIYNENQFLKQQNAIFSQKNNELLGLATENEELRQAFGLGEKEKFSLMPCHIISKSAEKDIILIDKGSDDGLALGMPAISADGTLIGSITQTSHNFSEVSLITAKDFSFDVSVRIEADPPIEAMALAKGEGGFGLFLNYAEKSTPIPEKSLVFTSLMGGNFPKGLLVGEVKSIKVNPAELFQTGEIKPYLKDNLSSSVFIIQNFQSTGS
ncbi:MAG: rod shape-determining protein MreC [Candidatus Pacebacteria bacterium]|nr:rod shape-determining protein MreC [Candidatus Paceibacterota bacterium]